VKTRNLQPHLATDVKVKEQLTCIFGLECIDPMTEYAELAFKELPICEPVCMQFQKILGTLTPGGLLFYSEVQV